VAQPGLPVVRTARARIAGCPRTVTLCGAGVSDAAAGTVEAQNGGEEKEGGQQRELRGSTPETGDSSELHQRASCCG